MSKCKKCEKRSTCTKPCEWLDGELNSVTKNRKSDKEVEFDPQVIDRVFPDIGNKDIDLFEFKHDMKLLGFTEQEQKIMVMYLVEGYTQQEIAGKKGEHQTTILRKIKKLTERLHKNTPADR